MGRDVNRLLYILGEEIEELLRIVDALELPDAWIAGGYIRNRCWNYQHGFNKPQNDVDVIYFDPSLTYKQSLAFEEDVQAELTKLHTGFEWSLTNQAWTHTYKDDAPYTDSWSAVSRYPETCTAIACQMVGDYSIRTCAPHGLQDLFDLVIRPTPGFRRGERLHGMFRERVYGRTWLKTWPNLRVKDR